MSWLGKFLFPKANRHDRRRKLTNLMLAVTGITAVVIAALLLHASGR
jgi:hypothetical protein